MSAPPRISVLLPFFNSADTIGETIDSILAQSFADFELLLLDDGSSEEIDPPDDPRIRTIRSERNLGLSAQLNIGIEQAAGEFIARIDADDIALPERFALQLDQLQADPDLGICGSAAQLFDATCDLEIWSYPKSPDLVHATLFVRSSFLHPGVIIRRSILIEHGLRYDESLVVAQDYDLWLRLLELTRGTNLPEPLTRYRRSESQLTSAQSDTKDSETMAIRRNILEQLGIDDLETYQAFLSDNWEESIPFFTRISDWLNSVAVANARTGTFPVDAFESMLAEIFFQRCNCATRRGFDGMQSYRQLIFADKFAAPSGDKLRLRLKSILKPALTS